MENGIVRSYLESRGFRIPSSTWYNYIDTYMQWYEGEVNNFHNYNVYNGSTYTKVRRYSLGMAKMVCEEHANLLMNEMVRITTPDEAFNEILHSVFRDNNFRSCANNLIEIAYALGTGAFVENKTIDGLPVIYYVRGNMIYPLSWTHGRIKECAFSLPVACNGKEAYYIQIHSTQSGQNAIENVYIDKETGDTLPLPPGIEPIITTGYVRPLFQIIRPNIVNNKELDCPMGMSVYGNAIDQLKGLDLVFDSYMNEFVLGRKRVIVPMSMARIEMSKDGTACPLFDPNDTLFYVYEQSQNGKNDLRELNPTIRATEHENGLQRLLNITSKKCGLGNDRFKFENDGVKTATEVISEKSELFQNLKKNELVLGEALTELTRAIAFLTGKDQNIEVSIDFDDSIIQDSQSIKNDNIDLVGSGLRSKLSAIMNINHCTKEEALAELKQIQSENMLSGTPDDWFTNEGGGQE